MEEGEEGPCLVGEERGKNTSGLMGESGEGEACLMGEKDGEATSSVGNDEACSLREVGE